MFINPASLRDAWWLGEDAAQWVGVVSALLVGVTVIAWSAAVCVVMTLVIETRPPKRKKGGA